VHLTICNQKVLIQISRFALPIFFFYFRGGRGGGYKELDEEELEEVKKRRKEAEEVGCLLNIIFLYM
jgi:hypothetical protein